MQRMNMQIDDDALDRNRSVRLGRSNGNLGKRSNARPARARRTSLGDNLLFRKKSRIDRENVPMLRPREVAVLDQLHPLHARMPVPADDDVIVHGNAKGLGNIDDSAVHLNSTISSNS
jgi:hypothetical protein